jgi:hypothetical protein
MGSADGGAASPGVKAVTIQEEGQSKASLLATLNNRLKRQQTAILEEEYGDDNENDGGDGSISKNGGQTFG